MKERDHFMKYTYREMPESMKGTYGDFSRNFGFSWKEFVITVPSPLFLITTYKSNGLPNACMQSWATFTSANHGDGFYAILASVNRNGHLYQSLQDQQEAVINFMSADCHAACMETIRHNAFETDEITASGLTAEKESLSQILSMKNQSLWKNRHRFPSCSLASPDMRISFIDPFLSLVLLIYLP